MSSLVLRNPNFNLPSLVYTDVSDMGLKSILLHENNTDEHIYISIKLIPTEWLPNISCSSPTMHHCNEWRTPMTKQLRYL